jgi:hypothetical protein
MIRKVRYLVIAALFLAIGMLGARSAMAAACTCKINNVTKTATLAYHVLTCTAASTACTITDSMKGTGGVSLATHLELNNDCAHTTTVAFAGDIAIATQGLVLATTQHAVYDTANAPNPPPGTTTGSGKLPVGDFSIINASADSLCFNICTW